MIIGKCILRCSYDGGFLVKKLKPLMCTVKNKNKVTTTGCQSMVAVASRSPPGVKRSVRWEPTAHNAPTSATVRTAPSATTSMGRVCATRVSRGRAARTASAPPASTDWAATSTALAGRRTHSGEAARFFSSLGRLISLVAQTPEPVLTRRRYCHLHHTNTTARAPSSVWNV